MDDQDPAAQAKGTFYVISTYNLYKPTRTRLLEVEISRRNPNCRIFLALVNLVSSLSTLPSFLSAMFWCPPEVLPHIMKIITPTPTLLRPACRV